MIAEAGHFALILALAVAAVQTFAPYVAGQRGYALTQTAAVLQLALIATAFAGLTHAYLVSDFSLLNVVNNSHSEKPLLYKLAGVWGNHEGSMVLWVMILSAYGALISVFGGNLPPALRAKVLSVQGAIGLAFLAFILITSNPFTRLDPPPIEGNGLNPVLQDPALAIHPPFLYAGYVGLSVAFSFAVAALIEGRVDPAWARWVRPWTLLAWIALTIGITLGSWWAYYELGWGGWWAWDPVENASFMPWLVATALLHSAIVAEKRNALKIWTVLLAILAFSLSLLGTFLVRSGVLTSVHAFAVDPERGLFILGILSFFIGGSLVLFAWRAPGLKAGGLFAPVSREGGLVVNNLLLCAAAATVLTGTLAPLVFDTLGSTKISVGAPYFNLTFGPIMLPLLLLMPAGPFLSWKRADAWGALQRLWVAALIAAVVALAAMVILVRGPWLAVLGFGLGTWMIAGSLAELAQRTAFPSAASFARLRGLPASAIGMTLAHMGMGVMLIGVLTISTLRDEKIVAMKPGDTVTVGRYSVVFSGETATTGPNYTGDAGSFRVTRGGADITTVVSERRIFRPTGNTTEVGLYETALGDVYVVMGDKTTNGGRAVRAYFQPLVSLIWLGSAIMVLGGLISLTDRRYRVGAPKVAPKLAPAE